MNNDLIATHLENIDQRLTRVEQFLPTLAAKEELRTGIAPLGTKEELRAAVALLATKEELRAAIAPLATKEELRAAIAPLATKEQLRAAVALLATKDEMERMRQELRQEIREEGERSRRHMDVLIEAQRGDIQLLAEHLTVVMSRLENR